jgi:hypothetical protein
LLIATNQVCSTRLAERYSTVATYTARQSSHCLNLFFSRRITRPLLLRCAKPKGPRRGVFERPTGQFQQHRHTLQTARGWLSERRSTPSLTPKHCSACRNTSVLRKASSITFSTRPDRTCLYGIAYSNSREISSKQLKTQQAECYTGVYDRDIIQGA